MSKSKKILIILAAVVILVIGGIYITLQTVLTPNAFKPQIAEMIYKVSGLHATFEGDVNIGMFPLSLRFENVTLDSAPIEPANADDMVYSGPDGKPLLHVSLLSVEASLTGLLDKELQAKAVKLDGISCALMRDAQGRLNLPKSPVEKVEAKEEHVEVTTEKGEKLSFSYRIHSLSMTNGSLVYEDKVLGTRYEVTDVALEADDITPSGPFPVSFSCKADASKPELQGGLELSGKLTADPIRRLVAFDDFTMQGELQGADLPYDTTRSTLSGSVSLDGTAQILAMNNLSLILSAEGGDLPAKRQIEFSLPKLNANLASGQLSAQPLNIKGNDFESVINIDGKNIATAPELDLKVSVPAFSPKKILLGSGVKTPALEDENTLNQASLTASMQLSSEKLILEKSELLLDASTISITGELTPATLQGKLEIEGDTLNIDRYLPAKEKNKKNEPEKAEDKQDTEEVKKIELPGQLQSADLTTKIQFALLQVAGVKMRELAIDARLHKGRFSGTMESGALYDGSLKAKYGAELKEGIPFFDLDCSARGIQLHPLLQDLKVGAPLTGTARVDAKVTTKGMDEKEYRSNLNGTFDARAENGHILGISLSPEAIQNAVLSSVSLTSTGGSTPYQLLKAAGTIKNGVANVSTIVAQAKPNSATGSGTVDLVKEVMNIKLKASVMGLATFPVTISGPLAKPGFDVDTGNIVEQGAKALGEILEAPGEAGEALGGEVGNTLNNLLEGLTK